MMGSMLTVEGTNGNVGLSEQTKLVVLLTLPKCAMPRCSMYLCNMHTG